MERVRRTGPKHVTRHQETAGDAGHESQIWQHSNNSGIKLLLLATGTKTELNVQTLIIGISRRKTGVRRRTKQWIFLEKRCTIY